LKYNGKSWKSLYI